jgi:hypothetical protein
LAQHFDKTSLAAKYLHFSPASLSFHIKLLASTISLQHNLETYFYETLLAAVLLLSLSFHIKPLARKVPLQQNLVKYFVETSLAAKYLHFNPAFLSFHIKPLASTISLQHNLAKYFEENSLAAALLLSLFISNR